MSSAHPLTRRELLGLGLGTAAGILALPDALAAANSGTVGALTGTGRPDLDIALQAARWIRTARVETANGVTWPADLSKPAIVGTDLYNGMPGVVLFHLELYHATRDTKWLGEARVGANELTAQLPVIDKADDCGLYTGLAGAAFVLEETHRATGDGRYRDAAKQAVAMIHARAQKAGSGASWTGASATNDIISGSAGVGLFLLWAHRNMEDDASKSLAAAAGRTLVERGLPANGGLKWAVSPTTRNLYPNFSHGTAGVSYFLATLYQATGERSFLDAALSGAAYLRAVANTDGNGFKVFHHEPGGEELFYLSWCHGPAGASRLFYRLADVTHDAQWLDLVHRAARATMLSGVPEQRTPGFWNNISQCCGNSGVGEWFLSLNRVMPDAAHADMVRRVAADTLRRGTVDRDGMKWIQAENRVSPDVVVAQTGFMQGAAGVGTFFLHLDAAEQRSAPSPIVWPDTPFV
jgi:lantibiotic modifying enzyme